MSVLGKFILPSALTSSEELLVNEFNDYKKRLKELSHHKSGKRSGSNLTKNEEDEFSQTTTGGTGGSGSSLKNPEQAKEAAKKLVQSGIIKVQSQTKDQGFKRASTLSSSTSSSNEKSNKKNRLTPSAPSPNTNYSTNPFVTASSTTPKFSSTDPKDRTIHIQCINHQQQLLSDALSNIFSHYGKIIDLQLITKHQATILYSSSDQAEKAAHLMNDKHVNGVQIKVTLTNSMPTENLEKSTASNIVNRQLVNYNDTEDLL